MFCCNLSDDIVEVGCILNVDTSIVEAAFILLGEFVFGRVKSIVWLFEAIETVDCMSINK